MTRAQSGRAGAGAAGIWTPLTSLVGRTADVSRLAAMLADSRLVTVTGAGGVGKSRLAIETARQVADQFPDGVCFVGLAIVTDPGHVPTEAMSALGVQQDPGRPPLETLAEILAPRRMLLVLDSCEHLLPAVAGLCAAVLASADEVRMLATSRQHIGIGGERRYRLAPLGLPESGDPGGVAGSAAAELFIERAGRADRRFSVTAGSAPLVARVVSRLEGMPLAIELAAARVEALGLTGLAERIDDALRLLTGNDHLAPGRHRSLTAVADWSYELLDEPARRVFRRLAVFPGPFTLDAAETVAGPDAVPIVARLVDCSLLIPPRPGDDQRTRYRMLQTLRAYGLARLREAGETNQAMAALAAFASSVARQAAEGLATSTEREVEALRWLDAEDTTLIRALNWGLEHDPDGALRLAAALVSWLRLRGRLAEARMALSEAVQRSSATDEPAWGIARIWIAFLASDFGEPDHDEDHLTPVIEAYRARRPPSSVAATALAGRAMTRLDQGDLPGAADDARRSLALAQELELDDAVYRLLALTSLSAAACYAGDLAAALTWTARARECLSPGVPGWLARWCHHVLTLVLTEAGDLDTARRVCTDGLGLARQVDDLASLSRLLGEMTNLERLTGDLAAAGACLREGIATATGIGHHQGLANLIEQAGSLCAATGRPADAVTLWTAYSADQECRFRPVDIVFDRRRAEYLPEVERALDPVRFQAARDRGARLPVPAAAEFALMVTAGCSPDSPEAVSGALLSPRERELVTLVAQGHTNAQIAARLHISARTVTSHLDRIRDKTGYRRRADLTRLAVEENLV